MKNTDILIKFLSGINRSLGIANKLIPVLSDSKPLLDNAKNIYKIINNKQNPNIKQEKKKTIIKNNNSPKFFI